MWRVVSPQKSSRCSVRRSSCLFLKRRSNMRRLNNAGHTEQDERLSEYFSLDIPVTFTFIHMLLDFSSLSNQAGNCEQIHISKSGLTNGGEICLNLCFCVQCMKTYFMNTATCLQRRSPDLIYTFLHSLLQIDLRIPVHLLTWLNMRWCCMLVNGK